MDVRLFWYETPALTIVGPINATRPVMTLVGALLIFGERLNVYQWIGVLMAIISFFMLSRSGKKEGIDFKHDKWIWFVVLAAVLGAVSGLYDKYLMGRFNNMVVQHNILSSTVIAKDCATADAYATASWYWDWIQPRPSVVPILSWMPISSTRTKTGNCRLTPLRV